MTRVRRQAWRDARAEARVRNARAGRSKHGLCDSVILDHGIVSEHEYFGVRHQEHSIEKCYVGQVLSYFLGF